jgi:hypothetical protein
LLFLDLLSSDSEDVQNEDPHPDLSAPHHSVSALRRPEHSLGFGKERFMPPSQVVLICQALRVFMMPEQHVFPCRTAHAQQLRLSLWFDEKCSTEVCDQLDFVF